MADDAAPFSKMMRRLLYRLPVISFPLPCPGALSAPPFAKEWRMPRAIFDQLCRENSPLAVLEYRKIDGAPVVYERWSGVPIVIDDREPTIVLIAKPIPMYPDGRVTLDPPKPPRIGGHEYDAQGWVILRGTNGQVFHVAPHILPMLEQQTRERLARLDFTPDATRKKVLTICPPTANG